MKGILLKLLFLSTALANPIVEPITESELVFKLLLAFLPIIIVGIVILAIGVGAITALKWIKQRYVK